MLLLILFHGYTIAKLALISRINVDRKYYYGFSRNLLELLIFDQIFVEKLVQVFNFPRIIQG